MLSFFAQSGNTEKFETWRKEYEARYKTKVDTHAFNTTDLIHVMFEALKASGPDRAKFTQAMHNIKDFQGLQTKISILDNGDMKKPFTPVIVKNGIFEVWTPK